MTISLQKLIYLPYYSCVHFYLSLLPPPPLPMTPNVHIHLKYLETSIFFISVQLYAKDFLAVYPPPPHMMALLCYRQLSNRSPPYMYCGEDPPWPTHPPVLLYEGFNNGSLDPHTANSSISERVTGCSPLPPQPILAYRGRRQTRTFPPVCKKLQFALMIYNNSIRHDQYINCILMWNCHTLLARVEKVTLRVLPQLQILVIGKACCTIILTVSAK